MLLCAQAFDDLIYNGGGIGLVVEAEGIGGDCWLTAFDLALCFFEMGLKGWPGFSSSGQLFHFLMSLEKMVERVMMINPMLISWICVSVVSATLAMFV
jgi:hypothetical protein